jgi:hypothetical protein
MNTAMTHSWVVVCAAPQRPEKITKINTDPRINGLRPYMSLNLDQMMMKPTYNQYIVRIIALEIPTRES